MLHSTHLMIFQILLKYACIVEYQILKSLPDFKKRVGTNFCTESKMIFAALGAQKEIVTSEY